jgi:uncharacterized protein YqcC (DUF446 family)
VFKVHKVLQEHQALPEQAELQELAVFKVHKVLQEHQALLVQVVSVDQVHQVFKVLKGRLV